MELQSTSGGIRIQQLQELLKKVANILFARNTFSLHQTKGWHIVVKQKQGSVRFFIWQQQQIDLQVLQGPPGFLKIYKAV